MPKKKKGERADGLVEYKANVGRNIKGKAIRKSFYGQTMKEAKEAADDYIDNLKNGLLVNDKITLAEWAKNWLKVYKEESVKGNTLAKYQTLVNNHIIPYFGDAPMSAIRPIDVKSFYKSLDCSDRYREDILILLHSMFDDAVDNDIILKNPSKKVRQDAKKEATRASKTIIRVYTAEQAQQVKEYASINRYGPEIMCLLTCGLRRGEMLALRWSDLDLKTKTLNINQAVSIVKNRGKEINKYSLVIDDPKTKNSIRSIPIPDEMNAIFRKLPKTSIYVFPTQKGNIQRPDTWERAHHKYFMKEMTAYYVAKNLEEEEKAREEKGKPIKLPIPPELRPHELRHTCASLMIDSGVDILTVSRFLGHSDVTITDRIYIHVTVDDIRRAIKKSTTTGLRQKNKKNNAKTASKA